VAVAPLMACGTSPVDGPAASSSQALDGVIRIDPCEQGAQTNVTWVPGMGTLEDGDIWWATGATWNDYTAYGAVNLSTQNVDEVAWVSSGDLPLFAAENLLCGPTISGKSYSPPTNPTGTSPGCIEPITVVPPSTCMDERTVSYINVRDMWCSDATYTAPVPVWCPPLRMR